VLLEGEKQESYTTNQNFIQTPDPKTGNRARKEQALDQEQ